MFMNSINILKRWHGSYAFNVSMNLYMYVTSNMTLISCSFSLMYLNIDSFHFLTNRKCNIANLFYKC